MIDESCVVREKCRIREHLFGPEQSGVPNFADSEKTSE
jgi:hypothetical protein